MDKESFFPKVLKEFKLDSFKQRYAMDMLVELTPNWKDYLERSGEFAYVGDQEGNRYFVCVTSKAGIIVEGKLTAKEQKALNAFEKLFKAFFDQDMDSQGDILKRYFPE